jgi:hypothetical protein
MRVRLHLLSPLLLLLAPAAHAAPNTACDLLYHPAAEALFGAPLAKTVPANVLACIYYNNPDSAFVNIHSQVLPDGMPQGSADTLMKQLPHKDYATDVIDNIPGLGESNFFITDKEIPKYTLTVLYHKAIITLIVAGSKNPKLRQAMIDTMKQAMTKF